MATPRTFNFTAKDLAPAERLTGTWAEIVVPNDYELVLARVEDYDNTAEGRTRGTILIYHIETSTGPCELKTWLPEGVNWKARMILSAHGYPVEEGALTIDFDSMIGDKVGGHIDFPRDDTGEPTSQYREIQEFFALDVAPPAPAAPAATAPAPTNVSPAEAPTPL